ncbi:MAG: aminotransferase class V-fold PLP-dependent enzyme [Planctomycetaceae bacterium]|nr:aminotransferase class V-fold PLP-dependent enzyme [Planctomycetaceae bacterium]
MAPARVYLDNAATSWPKPEAVYRAVDDYQRRLGAPAGRSSYAEAAQTERIVAACRQKVARLIAAADPKRIVFTLNGSDSLNMALHGLLQPGDHVVTSVCEHNSVLRPLRFLAEHRGVATAYVPCDAAGIVDPDEVRRAITRQTKLVAILHASNVTGSIQPIAEIGQIAKQHGASLLVDAAQSLGYLPIDVNELGCDLLAAPGHKGLLGPLGTGVLYLSPGIEQRLLPLRQGGTGTRSDEDVQPSSLPDRYESGNLNVPGIVGLEAGVTHLLDAGIDRCREHQSQLTARLLDGLAGLPAVTLYGSRNLAERVGVVSLNVAGYDPRELASLLDAQWSIQTRAGIHCAPRMHQALGTVPAGTLRLSIGHFTTEAEIDAAIAALSEL